MFDEEDDMTYVVVMNHEEQYSIWPADRDIPAGWRDAGKKGNKAECLGYVEEVWTDMRPLSLRKKMEEAATRAEHEVPDVQAPPPEPDTLVDRLCTGTHPVAVIIRPATNLEAFRERLDLGYVHIKFTGTRGGTELGVEIDRERTNLLQANLQNGQGSVHLVGSLTLNYVDVRCVADIELETLTGTGHLERCSMES